MRLLFFILGNNNNNNVNNNNVLQCTNQCTDGPLTSCASGQSTT